MVRPPRRLQELHAELICIEPSLRQQLHRAPSAGELAGALGVETQELAEAMVARSGYSALSLDAPTYADSGRSLGDRLPDDNDGYAAVERIELRQALTRLSERERRVIALRFVHALSQAQIGSQLGVSQAQVSRLLAGILGRLRDDLVSPQPRARLRAQPLVRVALGRPPGGSTSRRSRAPSSSTPVL